mgnify:CR=1 FL=1
MNSDLRDKISSAATAIEITLGLIILLACVVGSVGLVCTTELNQMLLVPDYFQERLSDACLIIIGIELIKMITSYTIGSVVVLSVGVLFVIRKYLYISRLDRPKRSKKDIENDVQAEVMGFDASKEEREKEGRP